MRPYQPRVREAALRRLARRFSGSSCIITRGLVGHFHGARKLGWITSRSYDRVHWRHDLTPAGAAAIEEHD